MVLRMMQKNKILCIHRKSILYCKNIMNQLLTLAMLPQVLWIIQMLPKKHIQQQHLSQGRHTQCIWQV